MAALDLRERECTYTRDAHKKRKRWLDGRLSFAPRAAGAGAVAKLRPDEKGETGASGNLSDSQLSLLFDGEEVRLGPCLVLAGDVIEAGAAPANAAPPPAIGPDQSGPTKRPRFAR